jgi:hemolysin activation/secretion protein
MKKLLKFITILLIFTAFLYAKNSNSFFLQDIVIVGTFPSQSSGVQEVISPFLNREITFDEIKKIRKKIEEYYKKIGYKLTKVAIPQQKIQNGRVKIYVNVGKIGNIKVVGAKNYSENFIRNGFALRENDLIDYKKMIKSLLLLNEYDDLRVESFLKKGNKKDSTDIVLKVKDSKPTHLNIWYDNLGSSSTSKNRVGAYFNHNNLMLDGDKIVVSPVISFAPTKTKFISTRYNMSLPSLVAKFGVGFVYADYLAAGDFSDLGSQGDTYIYSLFFKTPLAKTITSTLDANIEYSKKIAKNYILDSISSEEHIDLIDLGLSGSFLNAYLNISSRFGLIAGNINNSAILSRIDEDKRFKKLYLEVSLLKNINQKFDLITLFKGQYSPFRLSPLEMFSIGGLTTVRGFRSGFKLGDSGFITSIEGLYKVGLKKHNLKAGMFLDYGSVWIGNPIPGENRREFLFGGGVEVVGNIDKKYNFRVSLGYPINSTDDEYDKGLNLYLTLNAKIW